MKLCSRKIASGSPKMVCDSHTVQKVPARPHCTYCVSSGIKVTWMGMTCRAKTAANRMLRPLKSIQAKA